MDSHDLTVQAEGLLFYYLTPKRVPLFEGFATPFKRVKLEKTFALRGTDFKMKAGRITALLGRNGSGKTTLIKLLTGVRFAHGGTIKIFGLPPHRVRDRIGLCAGASLVYHRLTARENLEYFGQLYRVQNLDKRIKELADLFDLRPNLDQMVESFSFGMKAKLALARALVHSPDLLLLDEPTLGIDIELAVQIRKFIRELKCTVLLTTHYMEEAEELADDLCIIEQGQILGSGTKKEVMDRYSAGKVADAFTRAVQEPSLKRFAS